MSPDRSLSEPLPADPLPLLARWLAEATTQIRNATAMTLATADATGRPTARIVVCRRFDVTAGSVVFYSDRDSPKGRDLDANPRAAGVFYWEPLERQVRIEGPVILSSPADTAAYWQSRLPDARIAVIASEQSLPIASREELLERVADLTRRLPGQDIPRPERWVGYQMWLESVELWVGQPDRMHDRVVWRRTLEPSSPAFRGGPWRATRLQP